MSLARMVPAKTAGSAPTRLNRGTTTGRRRLARTGAREIIPIMDRARLPMARIPSSNFSPSPNRFPIMRSMAPSAMKMTMI